MKWEGEAVQKHWTRDEVEKALKEILVDALGVEEQKIVADASLVHDLGVESIDFLDIGFRVQQTFGVELPNKILQDKALRWRNLGELGGILKDRYGVQVTSEEIRQFRGMGIPDILHWVSQKQSITFQNGEAEEVAAELVEQLVKEIEGVGFKASFFDREEIQNVMLQNLNSPQIIEAMLRLFSVASLVDFIADRVGTDNK